MKVPFMKYAAWYLVVAMFALGVVPRVEAGFSPSELFALTEGERAADLEKIRKAIETKIVRERLLEYGFTEGEVGDRLSLLSDRELHQLALKLDELRVGGDGGTGVLIVVLLLAIALLLYLNFTGKRVVITE